MRKTKFILAFLVFILNLAFGLAQQFEAKRVEKILIQNRSVYLKGGFRASFSGASRISIKVDLPPNTIEWYYSFSTSKGQSATKNLGLGLQLASLLADTSTLTSSLLSKINVPTGEAHADIYLCDELNIDEFIKKVDNHGGTYSFYREGTVKSTKQAVVQIDDITSGTWYLGIKNPSTSTGLNINIEVVAIVEERTIIEKTENQQKAELYGNLAMSHYNNGEYEKCIEYCDKAILEYELGQVLVNKGLALLMIGKESEATELFIDAISVIKKEPNSGQTIEWAIKCLDNIILFNWNLKSARNIRKIYQSQR
ncbi:tetratricopeptide repeat protein [Maribacter sp. 2210JD10-5]|uniref:tetratricopeptide repeat protein n=1 Tax=Maribacter sp. 2210JD10-5 TaxID=3386272 RepID=UPI0039BCAFCE